MPRTTPAHPHHEHLAILPYYCRALPRMLQPGTVRLRTTLRAPTRARTPCPPAAWTRLHCATRLRRSTTGALLLPCWTRG